MVGCVSCFMKIYVAHSRKFDFRKELYEPVRNSCLNDVHEFILPHEDSGELFDSKEFFQDGCDLVVAEVSYPSIGLGIELGWANACGVRVVCFCKKGFVVSGASKAISDDIIEYFDCDELMLGIGKNLAKYEVVN